MQRIHVLTTFESIAQMARTRQYQQANTDPANTVLGRFVQQTILGYIKAGGSLVDDAEYSRRREICDHCESAGTVWIPGGSAPGCTECGCPFATKLRANEYFSLTEMEMKKSECPISKW